jgi:hypothetical protein
MLTTRALSMLILFSPLTACGLPEYAQGPERGYVGSIEMDGPDVGQNHYGDTVERTACSTDPNGATRLSFIVASRTVQFGRWRRTETQRGGIVVSAPNSEPHYEVDLPWSHMLFDAAMCSHSENAASVGPQGIAAGIVQLSCRDPERGDVLKVNVSYQGC